MTGLNVSDFIHLTYLTTTDPPPKEDYTPSYEVMQIWVNLETRRFWDDQWTDIAQMPPEFTGWRERTHKNRWRDQWEKVRKIMGFEED